MKQKTVQLGIVATLIIAAIGGVAAVQSIQAQAKPAAGPTKVAVCDIVKVFKEYSRSKDLQAKMEKRSQAFKAENLRRKAELDKIRGDMEGFQPGSDLYTKTLKQLKSKTIEREVWGQVEQESILRDHMRLTKEMLKTIKKAIGTISASRGIDIVIQLDPEELIAQNSQQLFAQINNRKVLYNSNQVDITQDVIRKVNEDYRRQK